MFWCVLYVVCMCNVGVQLSLHIVVLKATELRADLAHTVFRCVATCHRFALFSYFFQTITSTRMSLSDNHSKVRLYVVKQAFLCDAVRVTWNESFWSTLPEWIYHMITRCHMGKIKKKERKCSIKVVHIKSRAVKHIKDSSLANQLAWASKRSRRSGWSVVSPLLKTRGPLMKEPPRSALHHCHIKSK